MGLGCGRCTKDEAVPCSFALVLAIAGLEYFLEIAEVDHTTSTSNGAVVEQVRLDEAGAQSGTGSGEDLP